MTIRDYAVGIGCFLVLYALLVLMVVAIDTILAEPVEAAMPISSVLSVEQIGDVRGMLCE